MDAKPQRPLRAPLALAFGNENSAAAAGFHHRQKSTGNSGNMNANGGLKVPSKRSAFGDVSNTRQTSSLVDVGAKARSTHLIDVANKENTVQKGGFLVPAQRPKTQSGPSSLVDVHPNQPFAVKGSHNGAARDTYPQPAAKPPLVFRDNDFEQRLATLQSTAAANLATLASTTQGEHKSPRHHRSQPNLKPSQPLLRRTQSRVLDTVQESRCVVSYGDDDDLAPYLDAVEEMESATDKVFAAELDQALGAHSHSQPQTVEENHTGPLEVAAMPQAAMSEMEEYWEEDEEFYDEQAYTTAHSSRSTGENTTGGTTTVVAPKITAKIQKELDQAKAIVESRLTQEEVDEELWDVSMVAEYGDEIFEYMKHLEMKMTPNAHYMDVQTEIQWSMRSIMMEWVVQVHTRFTLLPETLFLTVNYIDRFLSSKVVSLGKLQLVGATAILIAAKYEEINCPSIAEIIYMCDSSFTAEEILKAERFMLSMLSFELGWPGPMSFLRRISKADDYDLETRTLAKYFLEITVMDERFVGTPPSYLAAAAHCLSRSVLRKGDWTHAHIHYSGYTLNQLKQCVGLIWECCQSPKTHHLSVYEKYCDRRYKKAAIYVEDEIRKGYVPTILAGQHLHLLLDNPPFPDIPRQHPQGLGTMLQIEG